MFVSSNMGTQNCIDFFEYRRYIEKCIAYEHGNEIWCSIGEEPQSYPCLSILVNGKEAVVNYFSTGNKYMYASLGDTTKVGTVQFEKGHYEIVAYQVIDTTAALECAIQFFNSQEKPSCIMWEEL